MTDGELPVTRPVIRRFEAGEWKQYRALRLEMLEDAPTAYVETLDSAREQTDRQWQERAALMAASGCVSLVAGDAAEPADSPHSASPLLAGGVPAEVKVPAGEDLAAARLRALMRVVPKVPQDPDRPRQAVLLSVYVGPELRGSGLADEMLRRAIAGARDELGAVVLELGVHEANGRAQAFYSRHGFKDTGRREPYPLDPDRSEIIMELPLDAPCALEAPEATEAPAEYS